MALIWSNKLTLETFGDFAAETIAELYQYASAASVEKSRVDKLCVNAYARLFADREQLEESAESFTPIEALKRYLDGLLSSSEKSRMGNPAFERNIDPATSQAVFNSVITRAKHKIEVDLPRYAPVYTGIRATVNVLLLMICMLAVILFIWLDPLGDKSGSEDHGSSAAVAPVVKPNASLLVDVETELDPIVTAVDIYKVKLSGPDKGSVADLTCTAPDGSSVGLYDCNGEYYAFFAPQKGNYLLTASGEGARLERYVMSASSGGELPLTKCSYVVRHDTPCELELFASQGLADHYEISSEPAHGTVSVDGEGTYTYTPENHYVGTDSFDVTVHYLDGASENVPVGLIVYNSAPAASQGELELEVVHTPSRNGLYIGVLTAFDPDGDPLVFSLASSEGCIPLVAKNGSYALQVDHSLVSGRDSAWFSFTISDGVLSGEERRVNINLVNHTLEQLSYSQDVYCYLGDDGYYTLNLPYYDIDGDQLTWKLLDTLSDKNRTSNETEVRLSVDRSTVQIRLDPSLETKSTETLSFVCTDGWATSDTVTMTLNILPNPGPRAADGNSTTIELGSTHAECDVKLRQYSPLYNYRITAIESEEGVCPTSDGWDKLHFSFDMSPGYVKGTVYVTVEDVMTGQTTLVEYTIYVK